MVMPRIWSCHPNCCSSRHCPYTATINSSTMVPQVPLRNTSYTCGWHRHRSQYEGQAAARTAPRHHRIKNLAVAAVAASRIAVAFAELDRGCFKSPPSVRKHLICCTRYDNRLYSTDAINERVDCSNPRPAKTACVLYSTLLLVHGLDDPKASTPSD